MDIATGDSLPTWYKPYNLSLKHTIWVQKELETLKKVGIMSKVFQLGSVPLWLFQSKFNLENTQGEGCT